MQARKNITIGEIKATQVLNFGKIVPDVGGQTWPDQSLAIRERNNGAQHALILGMGLAEIEVRHGETIIGAFPGNFNGTWVHAARDSQQDPKVGRDSKHQQRCSIDGQPFGGVS